jgi:hypothetical protein
LGADGGADAYSCAIKPRQSEVRARLAGERLAQLETWVSGLAPFEIEQSTGAVADAMTVRLIFRGSGTAQADEAQVQAMLDLASEVFAELWHVSETDTRYVMALQDVAIRSGPAHGYGEILQLAAGQTALVTGASVDGGWWRVICPDDTVGSCWLPAGPGQTVPTDVPGNAQLGDGLLATFDVDGERFRVWVTNLETIQQILDLQAGNSQASIPNGRILRGPGLGGHNLPWNWHLDPERIEMAEMTIELCDGLPSYVNENVEEFVVVVGRYCPWSAQLVEVRDLREAAQDCPSPSAETRLLVHETHSYCTLYPATHTAVRPNPQQAVIVIGSLLNVQDARLSIEVRDADMRTAEQVAAERLTELKGSEIEQSTITLAGIEAIALEPVPGQDLSRQVIVVAGGLLYELTFTPADPDSSAYADMQALYDLVIASWRFLPPGGRG